MRALSLAAIAALVMGPGGAAAVVPGAGPVLASLRSSQPAPAHLRVILEEVVVAPGPGKPARPPAVALRVEAWRDGRLQVDRQDLLAGVTVTERHAPGAGPAWLRLLLGADPHTVLAAAGVDAKRTSLAHDGQGVILWVVGAGPQDPTRPQVHVERRSGRLRRVVAVEGAEAEAEAVVLSGRAGDEAPAKAWPARITVTRGGRATTFAVTSVERLAPEPAPAPTPAAPR